ncbi:MAG: helix-turn-helix domain-containing protein [Pseudomonadales bacterium]|jgi:AcrR family transcriptional regulator|nr:helix-turn-helix domain-containing protein [Pseudomonadales bacterium]
MSETRARLLDAAERLFAEKGLHGTSAREIVAAAGQRNESAIQYHFGGREGLVDALVARRVAAIEAARNARLDALLETDAAPDVRALLACLVDPVVELCRDDAGFRAFLSTFGEVALAPGIRLSRNRFDMQSLARMREQLRTLVDVPEAVLAARAEALTRFILLSLSQRARSREPFKGRAFDRFFTNLTDMGAAMLTAEVSAETRAAHDAD